MTLHLPGDLEPHADSYDELNSPGCYALLLDRPDDLADEWGKVYDIHPPWYNELRDAEQVAYVGAAKNVLERVTDHVTRERRRVGLLSVCEIDAIHSVEWYSDVGRAFDHEGRHATELQQDNPEWFVHSR